MKVIFATFLPVVFYCVVSTSSAQTIAIPSAVLLSIDSTTLGNWRSAFGSEGYNIAGGLSLNSTYAAPAVTRQVPLTWAPSTSDVRALQKPSTPPDRIAAAWASNNTFFVDTNIADSSPHTVALYCVNFDGAPRAQSIDVLSTDGTILDTRQLTGNFIGGVYLVWKVTGHVRFRITNASKNSNAVVSGIFFGGPPAPVSSPVPAIPQLKTWEARMTSGASQFCNSADISAAIGSTGVSTEGNVWYYDGTKVYQQIAAYTSNPSWYDCASNTNNAYMNWVLTVAGTAPWPVGALNGWRIFPEGALKDFRRTGNPRSSQTVLRLAYNSAFAGNGGDASCEASRETAYIMNAFIAAERLGRPRNPLLATSVAYALGHIDQWFISKTCAHVVPFMVGLTLEALMNYYELTGDTRVPAAIQTAADGLWTVAWSPAVSAFAYDVPFDPGPTADLNLLVAPAYAWLWQLTGTRKYLDEGDQIFAGGVQGATFWSGKQFSQNYRSSFNYVKWRSAAPKSIVPLAAFAY